MIEIKMSDVIDAVEKDCSTKSLSRLMGLLQDIRSTFIDKHFVRVEIYNQEGNITRQISELYPSFIVWHSGYENTIGTNYVLVPSSEWNEDVKEGLAKLDSFVGHQVSSHKERRVKKGVELPYPYSTYRDQYSDEEIYRREFQSHPEWFEQIEIIDREWDNELKVSDLRDRVKYPDPEIIVKIG